MSDLFNAIILYGYNVRKNNLDGLGMKGEEDDKKK